VKSINDFVLTMNDLGFSDIRYLIWLGIAKYDPVDKTFSGPTEEEVGEWEIDVKEIGDHLKVAMTRAFRGGRTSDDEDEEEEGASASDPQEQAPEAA
jgi:hypothetical protein